MPAADSELDASFFNLIYQLSGSQPVQPAADRRQEPREPFFSTQRIAIPRRPGIPQDSEFLEVRCRDLTRQGFSFLLTSEPDFDTLVAALGTPPQVIYVEAAVSHWADVFVYPSGRVERLGLEASVHRQRAHRGETATPMVLVGCRFTKRLS